MRRGGVTYAHENDVIGRVVAQRGDRRRGVDGDPAGAGRPSGNILAGSKGKGVKVPGPVPHHDGASAVEGGNVR